MRNGEREKYNVPIIHSANNFKYVLLIIITTIIVYSCSLIVMPVAGQQFPACTAAMMVKLL